MRERASERTTFLERDCGLLYRPSGSLSHLGTEPTDPRQFRPARAATNQGLHPRAPGGAGRSRRARKAFRPKSIPFLADLRPIRRHDTLPLYCSSAPAGGDSAHATRTNGPGRNCGGYWFFRSKPFVAMDPPRSRCRSFRAVLTTVKTAGIFTNRGWLFRKSEPTARRASARAAEPKGESMTNLVESVVTILNDQLPGCVSTPGTDRYAAATDIWAKPVGTM